MARQRNPQKNVVRRLLQLFLVTLLPITLLAWWQCQLASAGSHGHSQDLSVGKVFEREISDVQVHSYPIELGSGQFLRADVSSQSLDLIISVIWPEHQNSFEWGNQLGVSTPVSWVARIAGTYRLEA